MASIVAAECPLEIAVLTGNAPNRPALPMPDPSFVTVHEVGNTSPGADEDMHRNFVHNGGGESQVSFHFVVGPTKAIQLIFLNENAWHASDGFSGRGNRDTIAIETIQIGDFDRTLRHLAWLIAEIFRNPRRFALRPDVGFTDDLAPELAVERIKQHNFWAPDKKNCPQFIRERGRWEDLLAAVKANLAGEAATPAFVPAMVPEFWSEQALIDLAPHDEEGKTYFPLGGRFTVVKAARCHAHGWKSTKQTRAPLKPGDHVDIRYTVRDDKNRAWGISRFGTWVRMSALSPSVSMRARTT